MATGVYVYVVTILEHPTSTLNEDRPGTTTRYRVLGIQRKKVLIGCCCGTRNHLSLDDNYFSLFITFFFCSCGDLVESLILLLYLTVRYFQLGYGPGVWDSVVWLVKRGKYFR